MPLCESNYETLSQMMKTDRPQITAVHSAAADAADISG
jgi:hypothetical protein